MQYEDSAQGFDVEKADKEFNDQLAKNIRLGFLAPDQLVEQFQGVFKEDVETYFKRQKQRFEKRAQVLWSIYQGNDWEESVSGGGRECIV